MSGRYSQPLRSRTQFLGTRGSRAAAPGASADARCWRRGHPPLGEETTDPRDHETPRGLAPHGRRLADSLRAVRSVRTCSSGPLGPSTQAHPQRSATHRDGRRIPAPRARDGWGGVDPPHAQGVSRKGRRRVHDLAGVAPGCAPEGRAQSQDSSNTADPKGDHDDDSGRL